MATIEVTSTGVRAPSLEEALAQARRELQEIFGDDLAPEVQTPQGQLAGLLALLRAEVGEAVVRSGNAVSVDHAAGVQLVSLGSLLGIQKLGALRSRVTATLTGVSGTNIPQGSRARTTAGDEFRTAVAVSLDPAGVTVEMEAVNTGAVVAVAGTLTDIVTVVAGWETITNASDAVPGRSLQTDQGYRMAYRGRTGRLALGPMDGLVGALADALAGRIAARENTDLTARVVQQFTLQRSHILVVAEEGSDGDLTRAVENHRGMGAGTMTAIRGGAHSTLAQLQAIAAGAVTWNGTAYAGLDLSGVADLDGVATALTTHLAADAVPPVVAYIDGAFVAQFPWQPGPQPRVRHRNGHNGPGL